MRGTIYLLHFSRPVGDPENPRGQARHYLGYTDNGVEARVAEHRAGQGSPLVRAAVEAGSEVVVVRTWSGDRHEERRLKNLKAAPRLLCPICRGETGT